MVLWNVLFLLCVTMCSFASTRAESVGYCVAIIITFFIHILEHTIQTRFELTDCGSHQTGAVLQNMNLLPRYNITKRILWTAVPKQSNRTTFKYQSVSSDK